MFSNFANEIYPAGVDSRFVFQVCNCSSR